MLTPQKALDRAKGSAPIDVAMLLMAAEQVAVRLRALAERCDTDNELASQLTALAAALDAGAGNIGRPGDVAACEVLDHFTARLARPVLSLRKGGAA